MTGIVWIMRYDIVSGATFALPFLDRDWSKWPGANELDFVPAAEKGAHNRAAISNGGAFIAERLATRMKDRRRMIDCERRAT